MAGYNGYTAAQMARFQNSETQKWVQELNDKFYIPEIKTKDLNCTNFSNNVHEEHDLNISSVYASWIEGFSTCRELVQNWYDRILESLDGNVSGVEDTGWKNDCRLLFLFQNPQAQGNRPICPGYILEQRCCSTGRVYIQLTNFDTVLSRDSLILGASHKKSKKAAGGYGEGMKVEINRLIAKNVTVDIFTGSHIWNFNHKKQPSSNESTLFLKASNLNVMCPHLSVCLLGSSESFGFEGIDRSKFLFMSRLFYDNSCLQLRKKVANKIVEILLHEKYHGKVFCRGIFVCEDEQLKPGIGLNFVADKEYYKSYKFTRDRDSLDCQLLALHIPNVLSNSWKKYPNEANFNHVLVQRVYDILCHEKKNEKQHYLCGLSKSYLFVGSAKAAREKLADFIVEIFQYRNGHTAYPIEGIPSYSHKKNENELMEVEYLQLKPVSVSKPLYDMLTSSQKCPTLDSSWQRVESDVYSMDEWVPETGSSAEKNALRLKTTALDWFGDAIPLEMIKFKAFPPGNNRPVLVGRKTPEDEPILVIDINLLNNIEKIHQWVKMKYSERCIDLQEGESCGGGCTMMFYSESLKGCLKRLNPAMKEKLERRQTFASMRRLSKEFNSIPLPPPPKKKEKEREKEKLQETATPPPSKLKTDTNKENINLNKSEMKSRTMDLISRCKQGTNNGINSLPSSFDIPSWVGILPKETAEKCYYEPHTSLSLTLFDVEDQSPLKLYFQRNRRNKTPSIQFMTDFAQFIYSLSTEVFSLGNEAESVCVFWETKERIAFNHSGKLFFNAYYAYTLQHLRTNDGSYYWYVMFCHELAHNTEPGHGKRHEWAEEMLIVGFMHRLLDAVNNKRLI